MPHWNGDADLRVLLAHRERLPVDAVPIVGDDRPRARRSATASRAIGGDLPVDGSIGARTALAAATRTSTASDGVGYFADDELAEFFHGGHAAGLQVGVHAIGDRAIEQVLAVWERVYHALDSRERRHFRARRHRIEHFEMVSPRRSNAPRCSGSRRRCSPRSTPRGAAPAGCTSSDSAPTARGAMNPFRTMVDRGVEVGVGLRRAGHRRSTRCARSTPLERHHDPAQRLSRAEAIRLHTIGSARVGHQEDKKGVARTRACTPTSPPSRPTRSPSRRSRAPPGAHGLARPRGLRWRERSPLSLFLASG